MNRTASLHANDGEFSAVTWQMQKRSHRFSSLDLKVVVLGSAGVGKTSLINRYCNGTFLSDTLSTIGAGFFTHTINVDGIEVTIMLWDTAGEERFQSVGPSLLRGANGVILVYDVTQLSSFKGIDAYMDMFLNTCQFDPQTEDLPVLLLGNKTDVAEPVVPREIVEEWAARNKVRMLYNVSAKTGDNVVTAFDELMRKLVLPFDKNAQNETMRISLKQEEEKKKDGCCF